MSSIARYRAIQIDATRIYELYLLDALKASAFTRPGTFNVKSARNHENNSGVARKYFFALRDQNARIAPAKCNSLPSHLFSGKRIYDGGDAFNLRCLERQNPANGTCDFAVAVIRLL